MIRVSFLCILLLSCFKEEAKQEPVPTIKKFERIPGEIQVLNGSSLSGVAGKTRLFLMKKGFDVVEVGNAREQNFKETLVVYRNPDWSGKKWLEQSLQNPPTLTLENPSKLVDVTIFVGRDIEERLHND